MFQVLRGMWQRVSGQQSTKHEPRHGAQGELDDIVALDLRRRGDSSPDNDYVDLPPEAASLTSHSAKGRLISLIF